MAFPPITAIVFVPLWILFSAFCIENFVTLLKFLTLTSTSIAPLVQAQGFFKQALNALSPFKNLNKFDYNLTHVLLLAVLLALIRVFGELSLLNEYYRAEAAKKDKEKKDK
eukprot:tig00000980_g6149.t1